MKTSFSLAAAVIAMSGVTNAWVVLPTTTSVRTSASSSLTRTYFASDPESDAAIDAGLVEPHVHLGNTNPENPCWQDIYDDDCAMSTMYSASFVAKKWIKAMPCAEGIEDCDMPEATSHPGYEGIDDVDVMGMLGIKRAKNLGSKDADKKP